MVIWWSLFGVRGGGFNPHSSLSIFSSTPWTNWTWGPVCHNPSTETGWSVHIREPVKWVSDGKETLAPKSRSDQGPDPRSQSLVYCLFSRREVSSYWWRFSIVVGMDSVVLPKLALDTHLAFRIGKLVVWNYSPAFCAYSTRKDYEHAFGVAHPQPSHIVKVQSQMLKIPRKWISSMSLLEGQ